MLTHTPLVVNLLLKLESNWYDIVLIVKIKLFNFGMLYFSQSGVTSLFILKKFRTCQKNENPNLESPCDADVHLKSRKRKPGKKYKSNAKAVKKQIVSISSGKQ